MASLVGRIIGGRYRVEENIARGRMGEVYKVFDTRLAAPLTMKVLHADLAEDGYFLRGLADDAQTLVALQHPNLVRFFGLQQADDVPFLLMEYVDGITLREAISSAHSPVPAEMILKVMNAVCSALHYAHGMGLVHSYMKPANIMLRSNGDVLVADFGIARVLESSSTATMADAGTPAYMAPEQVVGNQTSKQTDIYALGIVLYEMVTGGERPFTGDHAPIKGTTEEKVRWEQVNLAPPSPKMHNPRLKAALESVILKCLEKDPAQRYGTALDLLTAVVRVLGGAVSAGEKRISAAG